MRADLHAHSTASDGTLSPSELVALALASGLDVLALTDHDTVDGVQEAIDAAAGTGLTVVPGVELSAVYEDRDVHVLGYFVDIHDPELLSHLADLRDARLNRARRIVEALQTDGYQVDLDDVLALSDGGAVGRSHVARALVDRGHADSVADAFTRLIGRGRPYYAGKDVREPAEVVSVIAKAGGIAVLAHPGVTDADGAILEMLQAGLAGIEAYHAEHDETQRAHYFGIAAGLGLLVTGGSDYHGPNAPNPALGSVELPQGAVEALLAAGARDRD